ITGERAEESPGRARYAVFEPHRTDTRASLRRPRLVDHWRPVHGWSEAMVWDCLRRHRIVPALPYRIGFGRLSCLGCIFMSADQAATFRLIAPDRFARFAAYERAFGCTIRRDIDQNTLADRGRPFSAALQQPDLVRQALSPDRAGPVLTDHWRLPAGAFGESAGPG
ncbi:phosphoadenosine phosphosulfate reductase family protein, partial [Komagataeibacter sp. SM21]|uniref:phosphoadenosine phosphosulfate reductase domain-containing protein n=1 Tax=Komagataeibacter sp. SM21 TaxID=3242899 RepID=UPI00352784FE